MSIDRGPAFGTPIPRSMFMFMFMLSACRPEKHQDEDEDQQEKQQEHRKYAASTTNRSMSHQQLQSTLSIHHKPV